VGVTYDTQNRLPDGRHRSTWQPNIPPPKTKAAHMLQRWLDRRIATLAASIVGQPIAGSMLYLKRNLANDHNSDHLLTLQVGLTR
jgi:hypothetical protein